MTPHITENISRHLICRKMPFSVYHIKYQCLNIKYLNILNISDSYANRNLSNNSKNNNRSISVYDI